MCKCSDAFSLRVLIGRGLKPNLGYVKFVFRYSILRVLSLYLVGADSGEGPPVPIPNTVVKLTCVHNT